MIIKMRYFRGRYISMYYFVVFSIELFVSFQMEVDKNRSKRKEKEDVDNRKTKRSRADKGSTRTGETFS